MTFQEESLDSSTGYSSNGLRTFLDCIGTILPIALFLAPAPAMKRVLSSKEVGVLPSLPFSLMFLNCMLWVMFGLRISELPVILPNSVGFTLSVLYLLIYAKCCKSQITLMRETVFILVVCMIGYFMFTAYDEFYIATMAAIASVCMLASPLAKVATVVSTKNAAHLGPLPLCIVGWLCSFVWFILGYYYLDKPQVWICNLLGNISCTLSLVLFARYDVKRGEIKSESK